MRYKILILTLLFCFNSFGQTSKEFKLSWQETYIFSPTGEKISSLRFQGASIDEVNNWLPTFSHLQRTGSNGDIFSVELLDTQFDPLSSAEVQILRNKSFSDRKSVV